MNFLCVPEVVTSKYRAGAVCVCEGGGGGGGGANTIDYRPRPLANSHILRGDNIILIQTDGED